MSLVAEVIERHGGLKVWNDVNKIIVRLSFGGLAFNSRFNRRGTKERDLCVHLKSPKVVFHDYPTRGRKGTFDRDEVWITNKYEAEIKHRLHARDSFRKLSNRLYWDDLSLLYFAGYACWNYISFPILLTLPGVETKELPDWKENNEIWRRIAVRFPQDIPTHCKEQIYYFDEELKIVRHDYNPEIFASWARAAHYCYDHQIVDGLLIPSKRRVYPRTANNNSLGFPTLVWIDIKKVTLIR